LLGYEFTTRTSATPSGPPMTTSSMFWRITRKPCAAGSCAHSSMKNFCTLRSSFCEIRLHVE
jgi:hypothetical protein|tara:strand:+ start:266 stop:451 length:186 start_codon:yes stop_codon:yes gene_type:complete